MAKRIARVNQLIKKELSQIILREIDFPLGVLATLTRVETSANLIESKIYISVLPGTQSLKVFQILNSQIYNLQQRLNHRLKMRPIPKIKFLKEQETEEAGKIEEILEKLKNKEN